MALGVVVSGSRFKNRSTQHTRQSDFTYDFIKQVIYAWAPANIDLTGQYALI